VDIFDRSLLRIYLFADESTYIVRMSDIADSNMPSDRMVADNRGSGGDPPGGALYTWSEDHRPVTGEE